MKYKQIKGFHFNIRKQGRVFNEFELMYDSNFIFKFSSCMTDFWRNKGMRYIIDWCENKESNIVIDLDEENGFILSIYYNLDIIAEETLTELSPNYRNYFHFFSDEI